MGGKYGLLNILVLELKYLSLNLCPIQLGGLDMKLDIERRCVLVGVVL